MKIIRLCGTAWLVYNEKQGIIIDTGTAGAARIILKRIKSLGIRIPLIFLTHTHYDHAGSAQALRCETGAKVAVGSIEAVCLREGCSPVPKGTRMIGRLLFRAAKRLSPHQFERYQPVSQDIVEMDGRYSLEPYGFDAVALPLGAHTSGSYGLVIGDCIFVGDTVFGIGRNLYPPFADDVNGLPDAWQTIISSGAHTIYPGHGRKVSLEELQKQYIKRYEN